MTANLFWMLLFTALALLIVGLIFAAALRFVNSARAGNVRLKWGTRPVDKTK